MFNDIISIFQDEPEKNMYDEVQRILDNDLAEMELKWSSHTPREAFARFVSDKPPPVQNIFWGQFHYMESKVNAGRDAYYNTIQSGGSAEQARNAYYDAAKSRHVDLIEINKNLNIEHGLAQMEQQRLFNDGKYIYRHP